MQYRHPFKTFFTVTAIGTFLASTCLQAWADDAGKAKPPDLRRIMQDMGKDMQAITEGISREDWALVARIAPKIAVHAQPPISMKMRILAFIGQDAAKFKSHDEKTNRAAWAVEQAAAREDGQAVIASFANLQSTCLACHQAFRKPFLEHFHGKP